MPPRSPLRNWLLPALLAAMVVVAPLSAQPPAADARERALQPGEFLWHPEIAPAGPVVLVVSLDEQRAYVYRNGIAIGVSTISSGKEGKETPPGVFTILQKNREHYSNLYDNAPMPWMQRLTWDGIALHGGRLPGYPASQGCVRLPHAFAEKLFAITRTGDTVVVADGKASAASLVHPAVLAPIEKGGRPVPATLQAGAAPRWDGTLSPEGPVSVLVSLAERRVFVLRNGVAIGEAPLEVAPDFAIGGTVLMVMGSDTEPVPSQLDPARDRHRWSAWPILGLDAGALAMLQLRLQGQPLRVDGEFARRLHSVLVPGATVLLTDLPAVRAPAAGTAMQPLLDTAPANAGEAPDGD